jgi:putative polyketide hydroxylase
MAADRIDEVPVVIAGAGPAGLVAAITLARNGVGSLLVERNSGLSPLPRATSVSTRTMELWRSWGLEGEIRAGQLDLNSTGGWSGETLAATDGAVVPLGVADLEEVAAVSPTMLAAVPQDHTEPVLLRHLKALGLTEVRFGTELAALDQDAGGVTVVLRQRPGGAVGTVRAGHVVGADGAHSLVRRLLGIPMVGPDHLSWSPCCSRRRWPRSPATAATASTSSSTRRRPASWSPTGSATAGCTGGNGTRAGSGWRTTPTPA